MHCKHCGNNNPNIAYEFCCAGCDLAYKIINKLDLHDYYRYCKEIYNKTPMTVHSIENKLNYKEFVKSDGGTNSIHLIVEGIHCGSCVWLIESTLKKQDQVLNARLNMSTRRLTVNWSGPKGKVSELVDIIEKLGYKLIPFDEIISEEENTLREAYLLRCLAVSGFAAMSIMMISLAIWFGNADESLGEGVRGYMHWLTTLIAIPAALYAGAPFFQSSLSAIKARRSNMDVPISIAILVSCLISVHQTIIGGAYTYYDAAVSLVFFLLIGRYLDLKSRNKARERAHNIILSQVRSVTLVQKDKLYLVDVKKAKEGDTAFIAPGEKIPVDGRIIEGETEIDNSLITGETLPIAAKIGNYVNAGTINLNHPIKIRVTKVGEHTVLGEMIKLMEVAEQGKAKYVRIADKVASFYTPTVITLSLTTLALWLYLGAGLNAALLNAVTVMIITCPCALGLAVPVVQVVASSKLMSKGILIKTPDALEKLAEIDQAVFDKTGTLTYGRPEWVNKNKFTKDEIKLISSIASNSKHPLSKAVHDHELPVSKLKVEEIKGMGLVAEQGKKSYKLGNASFCEIEKKSFDNKIELWFRKSAKQVKRLVFEDNLKEDAKSIVSWLKRENIKPSILSGDRTHVVSNLAMKIGVTTFKSNVRPEEKYKHLEKLSNENIKALMVGDGLNDSAALKAAHVSISPSSAIDIAQTNSDIVIQGDKLWPVKESYLTAQFAHKLVMQNFALSLTYNLVTIPIAISGLATPIIAAIAMSLSSLMVVGNSLRLNRNFN